MCLEEEEGRRDMIFEVDIGPAAGRTFQLLVRWSILAVYGP